jgi:crossover junction endodeoxyribonuclease RusA
MGRTMRRAHPAKDQTQIGSWWTMTEIRVYGVPVPQGSKRAYTNKHTGRVNVVEAQSARVRSWRQAIIDAALESEGLLTGVREGPVSVIIVFWLPRPKQHYGTGRNASVVKPGAPAYPAAMPDLDKLARAVLDALTDAGCWKDDGQVVVLSAKKLYADGTQPGALILIGEP